MNHPESRQDYFHVENFEAVYADVQQTWQDPEKAQRYHNILSRLLKPQVYFEDGAEDIIGQHLDNGAQLAIALTHGKALDPVHIAAMASQNGVFEPIIGKTMIGAKVPLFVAPVIGNIVPDLGAVPVWRKKDVLNKKQSEEEQARLNAIRVEAGKAFVATEIIGMNQGLHMAKHVEGTRNKKKPLEILEVRNGYGKVVCGVDPDIDILLVTGAFYYGQGRNKTRRKPTMYLSVPIDQRRDDPEAVTRVISPALQRALNNAVLLHR